MGSANLVVYVGYLLSFRKQERGKKGKAGVRVSVSSTWMMMMMWKRTKLGRTQ